MSSASSDTTEKVGEYSSEYISKFGKFDEKIDNFFLNLNPLDKKRRPVTKTVLFEHAIDQKRFEGYRHAAHAMIWSPPPEHGNHTHQSAYVNMQMRFDGQLGFPGGIVDEQVTKNNSADAMDVIKSALIREIKEELNFEVTPNEPKYIATFVTNNDTQKKTMFILHTFVVQLTPERFKQMELNTLESTTEEVLGNIRVPLCVKSEASWTKYLTLFFLNNFISIADRQLLKMLLYTELISEAQMYAIMLSISERL